MDNKTPEQALKEAEAMQGKSWAAMNDSDFNPLKNPKVISIEEQSDGNYKLRGQRHGKMVELRAGKPEDCLMEFLTHE